VFIKETIRWIDIANEAKEVKVVVINKSETTIFEEYHAKDV
jgi:hypothetical protein